MNLNFRHVCLMLLVFLFLSGTSWAANYIVSGAPNVNANGLYVEDGIWDDVPQYTKDLWNLRRIEMMGSHPWVIFPGGGMAIIYYLNEADSVLPPNDGNWQDWIGERGTIQELTVTLDASSIPTLNEWGFLIMITLLIGTAIAFIKKKYFPGTGARC